jgi:hypothetical protein
LFKHASLWHKLNAEFKEPFEYYNKQLQKLLSEELQTHEPSLNCDMDIGKLMSNYDAYLNKRPEVDEAHFSRVLVDVFSKIMVAASENQPQLSSKCFLNNQEVHKILENCLCDYYLERFTSTSAIESAIYKIN